MFRFPKAVLFALMAAIALCLAVILISRSPAPTRRADAAYLALLQEAYATINRYYVEKPDRDKLVKSMLDGMLVALDPHSAYLLPEPYKEMEVQMAGAFGGVGIELGMREGRLVVVAPIDDTPASRAGIQPDDQIVKIDQTPTRGMGIADGVKRMRGQSGTAVTLTVMRSGNNRPLVFHLIRDIIRVKSIKTTTLEQGYGLIRISQFQERTGKEFKQALAELRQRSGGSLKGLVIDLRFNPGGLLSPAVDVANCFIGDDANASLIVSIKGRAPDANHDYHATLGQKEPRYPMVVLINSGSASASEIVAGALQDHKRAVVMGRTSFGKGSVQSVFPLPGNAALKLTTARYYTPNGRSIQARGIVPDVEVGNGKPVANGKETVLRENDLKNRLAPAGKGDQEQRDPHGGVGDRGDVQRDNQVSRALELLKSLNLVRERGLAVP